MSSPQARSDSTSTIDWVAIRAKAGPYPQPAYEFVCAGLEYTVTRIRCASAAAANPEGADSTARAPARPAPDPVRSGARAPDEHHVTGQELCIGLRDFAIRQYGLLAPSVLAGWHIRRTDDFGRMVFAMIDGKAMRKTAQDSIEDFRAVYDFDEAFSVDQFDHLSSLEGAAPGARTGRPARGAAPKGTPGG
ncbi:MAG TPA: hypothetical protein PKC43_04320 [Phycisphaerales bacterium]|nr:hypothetical protein [Phycisphaerales bacterium]HMP36653.1 hypothetical protein [Phycisphaerales bacterium]